MAQGVAWNARRLGIPCTVVVPDHAPRAKLDAIERLGARVVPVPVERWWQVLEEHGYPGVEGLFVHPVADPAVIAGNGTIGLEILEDLPDVDTVLVPCGGGGLSCGIACGAPSAAPAAQRLRLRGRDRGAAVAVARGRPSRRDRVPLELRRRHRRQGPPPRDVAAGASELLAGSLVVSLEETRRRSRSWSRRARVVAEGAGAVPVAAALSGRAGGGKIVCVVSGGNIDREKLAVDPRRGVRRPGW